MWDLIELSSSWFNLSSDGGAAIETFLVSAVMVNVVQGIFNRMVANCFIDMLCVAF